MSDFERALDALIECGSMHPEGKCVATNEARAHVVQLYKEAWKRAATICRESQKGDHRKEPRYVTAVRCANAIEQWSPTP